MPPPVRRAPSSISSPTTGSQAPKDGPRGPAIVIDLGSFETKIAFSDRLDSVHTFPTVVAYEKEKDVVEQEKEKGKKYDKPDFYVGKDALAKVKSTGAGKKTVTAKKAPEPVYILRYPYQRGLILDWDQIEAIFTHALQLLGAPVPLDNPVVLSSSAFSPEHHREGIASLFFELYQAPYVTWNVPTAFVHQLADPSKSALVVESGASVTHVSAVLAKEACNPKIQSQRAQRMLIAGQDVTKCMSRLMSESGYVLDPSEDLKVAQLAKTQLCYVCSDLREELVLFKKDPKQFEQDLQLPTGETLKLGRECFIAPEVLFDPSLAGVFQQEGQGIAQSIVNVIANNKANKNELLSNIVLSGGTLLTTGMADRVQKEVSELVKKQEGAGFDKNDHKLVSVRVVTGSKNEDEPDALAVVRGAAKLVENGFKGTTNVEWVSAETYTKGGASAVVKALF
jgi:actin-related protein